MDTVKARVHVFAVPPPRDGEYQVRDWPREPLFECTLVTGSNHTQDGGSTLEVRLEDRHGNLIAKAPYDGASNVISAEGSAHNFVLLVQNGDLRAVLGAHVLERTQVVDLSMALQSFARRKRELERMSSAKWSTRSLATQKDPGAAAHVPALAPPPADLASTFSSRLSLSDSDDEFGDFQ